MSAHKSTLSAALRFASLSCIMLLAVLSLLPGEHMVRTGLPGRLEHFIAYAGSGAVTWGGYGDRYGTMEVIGFYWAYAGILEYLQQFSRVDTPPFGTSSLRLLERFAARWRYFCLRGG